MSSTCIQMPWCSDSSAFFRAIKLLENCSTFLPLKESLVQRHLAPVEVLRELAYLEAFRIEEDSVEALIRCLDVVPARRDDSWRASEGYDALNRRDYVLNGRYSARSRQSSLVHRAYR